MQDVMLLFEKHLLTLPRARYDKETAIFALALHHLAMRFHAHAGKRALSIAIRGARVRELPESFGFVSNDEQQ
jgi:hypothetical protein